MYLCMYVCMYVCMCVCVAYYVKMCVFDFVDLPWFVVPGMYMYVGMHV